MIAVTARHDFTHGGEIIRLALHGFQFEFAVFAAGRFAVNQNAHGGDSLRALDMTDIKTLNAFG